jgi:hypothetical protein
LVHAHLLFTLKPTTLGGVRKNNMRCLLQN